MEPPPAVLLSTIAKPPEPPLTTPESVSVWLLASNVPEVLNAMALLEREPRRACPQRRAIERQLGCTDSVAIADLKRGEGVDVYKAAIGCCYCR